jgi:hypothetical protein
MYTCISFPHDVDTTGGHQLQSAFFLEWGYHSRQSPIQVLTVPMLLHFCARNRGNRCFNIIRLLAFEFGLLRMVRQPSADAHVIWVARHKVTRPQIILKFRPPSSLDYRTRHGSQSREPLVHGHTWYIYHNEVHFTRKHWWRNRHSVELMIRVLWVRISAREFPFFLTQRKMSVDRWRPLC